MEGKDIRDLQSLRERGFLTIVDVDQSDLYVEIGHELDSGEAAAITFAVEQDADLLLLDEREGRRVARRHDISVTGVIGLLLRGAREGQLDIRSELDALRESGFWISDDLYAEAIRRAPDG